jgi:hypothetical protein
MLHFKETSPYINVYAAVALLGPTKREAIFTARSGSLLQFGHRNMIHNTKASDIFGESKCAQRESLSKANIINIHGLSPIEWRRLEEQHLTASSDGESR